MLQAGLFWEEDIVSSVLDILLLFHIKGDFVNTWIIFSVELFLGLSFVEVWVEEHRFLWSAVLEALRIPTHASKNKCWRLLQVQASEVMPRKCYVAHLTVELGQGSGTGEIKRVLGLTATPPSAQQWHPTHHLCRSTQKVTLELELHFDIL